MLRKETNGFKNNVVTRNEVEKNLKAPSIAALREKNL